MHQGLIAHGEHLTNRCQGWTDDMVRQKGWAPEVAQAAPDERHGQGRPAAALSARGLDQ